jgi:hypothetical protein
MMRAFLARAFLISTVIVLFAVGSASSNDCYTYPDKRVTYFWDCECYACAYTGSGCTVCTDGGSTCYTDGATCGPLNPEP